MKTWEFLLMLNSEQMFSRDFWTLTLTGNKLKYGNNWIFKTKVITDEGHI
jgi:hypothetical protein